MTNDSATASFLIQASGPGTLELLEKIQLMDRHIYLSSAPISPNHMGGVGNLLTFVCTPGELAKLITAVATLIAACRANINIGSVKIEPIAIPPKPDPETAVAIARLLAEGEQPETPEGSAGDQ